MDYTGVNGTNYNVSMNNWNGNWSYEIPGQNNIGYVEYFIWANDTSDNDNWTPTYQIQIYDVTNPLINHTPITSANIDNPINITANVTDDAGVVAVYLNYTDINGVNQNISMNKWNSNWSYNIPGQDSVGVLKYFIWCNDTSGNDNKTQTYQIPILDVVKPEIEHMPVTSANVSEAINITAQITDDIEVDTVYLNYIDINGVNHNVSMTLANGNWNYNIPGQASAGVIDYFIWCNDTSGNDNRTIDYIIQINEIIIPDTTPPIIIFESSNSVNVSISSTITITFDESMNTTSVQNAITISPAVTISSFSWNADNTTLTIILSENLSYNMTYNITVGIGAKDFAGNVLEDPISWEFTTEVEEIITNGHDDNWLVEYWWVIIIIIIAIIITVYLFQRFRKEEKTEEYEAPIEKLE